MIQWIILVNLVTIIGSVFARRYKRPDALIALYSGFVIISNILAYKITVLHLGGKELIFDAATYIFSVTFLLTDIVNERFGRKETQRMILITFATQIAVAFFIWMAIELPKAPTWGDQEAFARILGFAPRIIVASWIAFLASENLDAVLFSWFKRKTRGKHLWMRNALSSLPAMALDSAIFTIIAFYGMQPLVPMIIGLLTVKWMIGIVGIPFIYLNRWILFDRKLSVLDTK